MLRSALISLASLAIIASPALAAPCKDAKGKFTKCPPKSASAATGGMTRDANGKCHIAAGPKKGQFTKC